MATTRLIPMHKIKNQSVAYTVHERIDYAINPAKTLGGELVTAYGCDPATAVFSGPCVRVKAFRRNAQPAPVRSCSGGLGPSTNKQFCGAKSIASFVKIHKKLGKLP